MKFAVNIPNCGGDYADIRLVAEMAHEADEAGWDAFFVWDHINPRWGLEVADPWITLAAAAMRTQRIKLGTMVTPLPRRRPWKVARELASLDQLTAGRMILGVGLGVEEEYATYHEPGDDKMHSEMLDEALELLQLLWSGETITHHGQHYQLDNICYLPRPVQQPRIPIWVAGRWPNKKPLRRAARWDGAIPVGLGLKQAEEMSPAAELACLAYVRSQQSPERAAQAYDYIHYGRLLGEDPAADIARVEAYAQAGVTWWSENISWDRGTLSDQRAYIRKGPPRL